MTVRSQPRGALPAPVIPAALGIGLLFGGLDNGFGNGLICLAAAVLWLWQLWRDAPSRTIARALLPILTAIGGAALWAWWASIWAGAPDMARALAPDLAAHELIGIIGNALVFALAAFVGYRRRSLARDIDWLILFLFAGLLIGAMLRFTDNDPLFTIWDRAHGKRFTGTLNNANVAANVYAVLALLAFCRLLAGRAIKEAGLGAVIHWVAVAAIPAALFAILSTGSRTTIVTVVAIGALLIAVHFAGKRGRGSRRPMLALAGVLLLLALLATPMAAIVNSRFDAMQDGATGRWLLWSHYADIASASPWLGYGLGSFPIVNIRYPGAVGVAQQLWMVNSPHNIVLHLMLEGGLPFLLGYAIAAALVTWTLATAVLRGWLRLQIAGLLAGATIILTGSMVDIVLEVPAPTALFLVLVGLCFGQAIRARTRRPGHHVAPA